MWSSSKALDWYGDQRRSVATGVRRIVTFMATNRKAAVLVAVTVIAMVAAVIGYLAWTAGRQAKAADLLFRAVRELTVSGAPVDAARQEEGVRLLREVTAGYPRTAPAGEATLRLGMLHFALGEYEAARNVYLDYLARYPRGPVGFAAGMGVGDTYLSQGNYDKAVESYFGVINQFPEEPLLPEAHLNLARAYMKMDRVQDAVRLYEKVAEGYPNSGWDRTARAELRKLGGR